jgi:DNA-binding NarL/FixJ family response regulator
MRPLRILIADDHHLIREGLRRLLAARHDWEVCAEAGTGREAVEKAKRLKPDVAILDFSMPELNGLDATREIRKAVPKTEVLMLTMHEDGQLMQEVWAAGARGCVLKSDANELLIQAVERLAQHEKFFTPKASGIVMERLMKPEGEPAAPTPAINELTPREREVLQLIVAGKSTKEVASVLGVSVKTAETHRANLMRTLGIHSVTELVLYAVRNKLIEA